ncbi:unnamed protein product [Clavelina lepadiformis]|uniref:THAP-type domain-containing protein n=1 Tax=Clavelina lepadiformis TaxID=159417 RepID=A0ABP0F7Q5_CLALP
MVTCSAYNCTNRSGKTNIDKISFHTFPLSNQDLCKKWIVAMKRDKFKPTKISVLCGNHFKASDFLEGANKRNHQRERQCLKNDAVPSVFCFPSHLCAPPHLSRKRKQRASIVISSMKKSKASEDKKSMQAVTSSCVAQEHNYSASVVLTPTKSHLRKKIKILRQKIRRSDKKVQSLKAVIDNLKSSGYISEEASTMLANNFSGITKELFRSQLINNGRNSKGHRYNDEIKKFASTLHFYSPKAYDYLRRSFSLPAPSSLADWASSVNCEPGFFIDVFSHLQKKANTDKTYSDCALMCDAMHIRSHTPFNKFTGKYEGFVNYGEGILPFDTEAVASEALVFMLVGLQGCWKYPVGYVLCNKMTATDLKLLIFKAIEIASSNGLNIVSVTCDGCSVNLQAMCQAGCKIGQSVAEIDGAFRHPSKEDPIYFMPDPCHMLKLARNALADLGIIHDGEKQPIKWKHISNLHKIQQEEGLKFGNSLSVSHIEFQKHKMKVKFAAQTISSSVADAIEFLMKYGHEIWSI